MSQHELSDFEIKQALSGIRLDSAHRDAIWETVKAQRPARAARGNRRHMEKVIVGYCAAATAFVLTITVGVGMFNGLFGNTPAGTETEYRPGEEIPGDTKTIWADQEIAKERLDEIVIDGLATYYRIHNDALDGQDDYEVYLTVPDAGKEILLNVYSNRTGECEPIYREASMADYENGYEQVFSDPRILYDAVLADLNRDGVEELFLSVGCHETRKAELDGNFTESEADGYDLYVANGTEVHRIHKIASDLPVLLGNESDGKLPVYSGEQVSSDFDRIKEQGGYRAVYRVTATADALYYDEETGNYVYGEPPMKHETLLGDREGVDAHMDQLAIDERASYYRIHNDALDGQDNYELYMTVPENGNAIILNVYSNRAKQMYRIVTAQDGVNRQIIALQDVAIADLDADTYQEILIATEQRNNRNGTDECVVQICDYNTQKFVQMNGFEGIQFIESDIGTLRVYTSELYSSDLDRSAQQDNFTLVYSRPYIESGIFGNDDNGYDDVGNYKYCYTGGVDSNVRQIWGDKEGVVEQSERLAFQSDDTYRIHNLDLDSSMQDYEVYVTKSDLYDSKVTLTFCSNRTGDTRSTFRITDSIAWPKGTKPGSIYASALNDVAVLDLNQDGIGELILSVTCMVETEMSDGSRGYVAECCLIVFDGERACGVRLPDKIGFDTEIVFKNGDGCLGLYDGQKTFSNNFIRMRSNRNDFIQIRDVLGYCADLVYDGQNYQVRTSESKLDDFTYTDRGLYLRLNRTRDSYTLQSQGNCTDTEIVIPETWNGLPITAIGEEAFAGPNSKLEKVVIPGSVERIGMSAFEYCTNLREVVFSEGLKGIGPSAFSSCRLEKIVFPESLEIIEESAFTNNSGLTSVVIPKGVQSLGRYAFSDCQLLEEITILNEDITIWDGVFSGCGGVDSNVLKDVYFAGSQEKWEAMLADTWNEELTYALNLHFE